MGTQREAPVHTPEQESLLHEPERIRLRVMIQFFIWFFVIAIVIHILIYAVYVLYRSQARAQSVPITGLSNTHVAPPEPRLQPSLAHDALPRVDMETLRQQNLEEFRRRGWVDETGRVRVPVGIAQRIAEMSAPPATRGAP